MHAYRIEFHWQSALRGQETRAQGFRANKGERLVFSRQKYSAEALPQYRELIVSEAIRAGMKDIRVRITAIVRLPQQTSASRRSSVSASSVSLH
ncbi:hypothetical protein VWT76_15550 [Xanthomonas citri pv. citri]|uniref:hypothetical protein n=1 Tax=Xanthomonas TaxID=338 RepID=UPI000953505A|nr:MULTISPECIES: hypothetical protein [Xanthomonas]MBD5034911.1 hypothetical protein [Xanthomonas citri pv. citri]MBD5054805.1 hypothetical protein [Xanthomonas citri pv. citri]MCC8630189.1 hypothetical protein [Xanthomonas vesicatoria]OLR69819.1 hypothetical protein BI311_24235 [Xanthomonas citri pv. citri]